MQHDDGIRDSAPWLLRTAFRPAAAELKLDGRTVPLAYTDQWESGEAAELFDALRWGPEGQRAVVFLHYCADSPVKPVAQLQGTTTADMKIPVRVRNSVSIMRRPHGTRE